MELLKHLSKETIVITNYAYKDYLLKELSKEQKLYNISFLSMKELINRYYFSYDHKSIYYLMDKYNLKYDIADLYLKNLYYIEDKFYNNSKLDKLVSIKKELNENCLLIYDKLFNNYLKNKKLIFYGFNYFKLFEQDLIKKLESICDVEIIKKSYEENKHEVSEFNTLEEECEYVAVSILKLLEKKVSISNIKITNINSDYIDILNRTFNMHGLSLDYKENRLISTKVVADFFDLEGNIEKRIEILNSKYKNNPILEELINIANKYLSFSNLNIVLDMLKEELKTRILPYDKTSNMIEVIDYKNYPIKENDHVFMMSFNQSSIPIIYKDEDYITDNIKEGLLLDNTSELNKYERENAINNIRNIKNLVITYKNISYYDTFYPSNLIPDLNYETKKKEVTISESYSNLNSKIKLAKLIDEYLKTGMVTDNLKILYSNYKTEYMNYDNSYKNIDKDLFKDYIENSYNLSYSSLNSFYKCPFRYYISNVLKLNIFEDTFATYLGSLFHYVLENNLKNNTDVDLLVKEFVKENDRELTYKERFFINRSKKDMNFALETIRKQLESTNLKKMLFENEIEVVKEGDITVTFKGFIDKIMYEEKDNKTIMCIIDYKTGYVDIDLRKVPFGLSMQLPIYLYLASNSKLKNAVFAGFYIQRVLNNEVNIDFEKSYTDQKEENLKLNGYSNSDKDILYEFDHTYKNSSFIRSLKLNKNEKFSYYSKILNNYQINNLINLVDSKIENAINEINNCNFKISPKTTEKENLGCEYCNFSDICFKENKDLDYITPYEDLSFLGGDHNA